MLTNYHVLMFLFLFFSKIRLKWSNYRILVVPWFYFSDRNNDFMKCVKDLDVSYDN